MSEIPEIPERDEHQVVQDSVADLVRRSLIQLGDMDAMQDQLRRVSDRMSKITPPPEGPKQSG